MAALELYEVRQFVVKDKIPDVRAALLRELQEKNIQALIVPGHRIAVTVGSRGIACLPDMVQCLVEWLKERKAVPIIVPAMGSHGNASAEGQAMLLREYGISEDKMGAPVVSSMEVVQLGKTEGGAPVYLDKVAAECDGIIVLNRIKPHTTMKGPLQSGLVKMLAVGLGNRLGAESMHRYGLDENVPQAARLILKKAPVLFGAAVVENADKAPYKVAVMRAGTIEAEERALLEEAQKVLPLVPFDPLDTLLVHRMGKDISGTGMDTNVIGRWRRVGGPVDREIRYIGVFDLTADSAGNAIGMGMADFITRAFYRKINFETTYTNALTADWPAGAKMPVVLESEKAIVEKTLEGFEPGSVRLALIDSTMNLEVFWISRSLREEADAIPSLEVVQKPLLPAFDEQGKLFLSKI